VPTIRGDYRLFYAQLRDAVRGTAPPPVDPVDAIRGLRVLEAAERSARSGSVVVIGAT
jgi:scyllo-inositol 2-dehydrogenase (NADP+)